MLGFEFAFDKEEMKGMDDRKSVEYHGMVCMSYGEQESLAGSNRR